MFISSEYVNTNFPFPLQLNHFVLPKKSTVIDELLFDYI